MNPLLRVQPNMSALSNEMRGLQEGGNVDLFNRPQIDSRVLKNAGWNDAGDGTATVFSSTYTNRDGSLAGNFTPIKTAFGNYAGVMSPGELTSYAEKVMEGAPDVYGLRIGAPTTLDEAIRNAERVHELQAAYYDAMNEYRNLPGLRR